MKKPIYRVTYNEITKGAIQAAMENPGEIDQRLVDSPTGAACFGSVSWLSNQPDFVAQC